MLNVSSPTPCGELISNLSIVYGALKTSFHVPFGNSAKTNILKNESCIVNGVNTFGKESNKAGSSGVA